MKLTPVVLCLILAMLQKADAGSVDYVSIFGPMLCNGRGVLDQSSIVCQCATGFTGNLCDQVLPPPCPTTTPVPKPNCQNGGIVAQASDGSYQCKCPPAFIGNLCENPFCQNSGTYTSAGTCTCTGKFFGTLCEKSCPTNFKLLSDANGAPIGCYNFVLAAKTWSVATSYCATLDSNSYLIQVDSAAENTAVKTALSQLSSSDKSQCGDQFYASGQRLKEGDCTANFYWKPYNRPQTQIVQGSSFTDWSTGNPSCSTGSTGELNESCVVFWGYPAWKWNDMICSRTACSVCEIG